jgi:hypothetical protein
MQSDKITLAWLWCWPVNCTELWTLKQLCSQIVFYGAHRLCEGIQQKLYWHILISNNSWVNITSMMSLWAYNVCRETLETVKNRADTFTIITALAHALPATPLLVELPAKPFFYYVLSLQCNTKIFSLKLQQIDDEMFIKHRVEVSVLFQGVIFHDTHPWMERNTTLKTKLLHFTFFLCTVCVTLTQMSESIKSLLDLQTREFQQKQDFLNSYHLQLCFMFALCNITRPSVAILTVTKAL